MNPDVDHYIARSAPFAQLVLQHIRKLIHQACPEVEEKMKWSFPHFDYKGMMCSMAAFKQHCAFTFWKGALLEDPNRVMDKKRSEAMGQFGRIALIDDLPEDAIVLGLIRDAMRLNDEGIKLPPKPKKPVNKVTVPDILRDALGKNKKAGAQFEALSAACQREYIQWITEAKREETRERRVKSAIEWISEGKHLNWKYQK
ncbi:MAG: YdeI/OmpD-associated family protein [Flavobacteriales bacterium]|nr:YdeI/OmpD-associated family protein [Flavobacteriales bacterium]MCB9449183.1 YdeI/OmpD-associated family protein [Flavobacteriales bacterium]